LRLLKIGLKIKRQIIKKQTTNGRMVSVGALAYEEGYQNDSYDKFNRVTKQVAEQEDVPADDSHEYVYGRAEYYLKRHTEILEFLKEQTIEYRSWYREQACELLEEAKNAETTQEQELLKTQAMIKANTAASFEDFYEQEIRGFIKHNTIDMQWELYIERKQAEKGDYV